MSYSLAAEVTEHIEPLIPALRRYARALMRNREMADDLVQDCLERVVSRWNQRRSEESTRSWMFAIAHNLAVNRLRQQTQRGPHLDIEDVHESALVQPARQEDRIRHNELMRALEALPADQRAAVVLVCVDGLAYAEAARELEVPIGTVMSRLARARAKLQRALDGPLPQHEPTRP
ncbi:RNA polymerase sigma factor [Piscinibacter sp. XHJ-5]|uniref:RNA polymerase sigma factor n=1 Tax=Piscinibacter sp. XHJ-5 TaxID=3037797 RepID=UPI0024532DD0|nr:RNA polymerase sigma factor [Piscinibacter sp. XHJ-5]